jgi:hypothetical protein
MDNFGIRDRTLIRLAAQSPAFAKEHTPVAPAVRKMREEYQREILSIRGVEAGLDKLRASGTNRERVLMCLAAFVQLERHAIWTNRTKEIQSALAKLARDLRRTAEEVKKTYSADNIRPDLYALSLGFSVAPAPPPYDPRKTIEGMGETAADLEAKAATFGRYRKRISPVVKRAAEEALLRCVSKPQPGSVPECPLPLRMVLVGLLDEVCEKYGIENSFTAGSLLKTFNRHVLPRFPEPRRDKTPSQK